jgi:hypothetical protein
MSRPWWREWTELSRTFGGSGRALRVSATLGRAFRLQKVGRLAEALAEAQDMLMLVHNSGQTRTVRGAEIVILGAQLIDELATGLGTPGLACGPIEDAIRLIEGERFAFGDDGSEEDPPFGEYEAWLRYRLQELRARRDGRTN